MVLNGIYVSINAIGTQGQALISSDQTPFLAKYQAAALYAFDWQEISCPNAQHGGKITVAAARTADLLSSCYVNFTMPGIMAEKMKPGQCTKFAVSGCMGTDEEAQALEAYGSKEMKAALRAGRPVTSDMLDEAKQVMAKTLYGTSSSACAMVSDCPACTNDPHLFAHYANSVGWCVLQNVELRISGTKICHFERDMHAIFEELYGAPNKSIRELVGTFTNLNALTCFSMEQQELFVPLNFWFCRDAGVALPICAMPFSVVEFTFHLEKLESIICVSNENVTVVNAKTCEPLSRDIDMRLWVKGYVLPMAEHNALASADYEVQYSSLVSHTMYHLDKQHVTIDVPFNLCVTSFTLFARTQGSLAHLNYSNFATVLGKDALLSAKVKINNLERTPELSNKFLRCVNAYEFLAKPVSLFIYNFFFADNPTDMMVNSGFLNLSKLEKTTIDCKMDASLCAGGTKYELTVMANQLNTFRIISGVGGTLYAT
jgi:hypothetical protein